MATMPKFNACYCGYQRSDKGNWSRHLKTCRVAQAVQPLQQEVDRLRSLQDEAAASAARQREDTIERLERRLAAQEEQHAELVATVAAMDARMQALVPGTVNNIQNNTINTTININIHPYEKTPLPPRKTVASVFKQPAASIPTYFGQKHLAGPKTRNLRITDARGSKMSVYTRDRRSGVNKWVERDRRDMLIDIVRDIVCDLYEEFSSPKDPTWKAWRQWAVAEGLKGYSEAHEMDAFKSAVDQIEQKIIDSTAS